jgi:hypothetical protein
MTTYTNTALLLALAASAASADIMSYIADDSMVTATTNSAQFEGIADEQSLSNYQEDGFAVGIDALAYNWDVPGLDDSGHYYPSTGALALVSISLVGGGDFDTVDMQIASGWNLDEGGPVYLWAQAYSMNTLVAEFDIDSTNGDYVGFTGGGFDTILIGAYVNDAIRDQHNPLNRNAIVIDNLSAGQLVPAPGALAMLGLGTALAARRRRN